MKKYKFEDFIKINSNKIFETDSCGLENDTAQFEKLLDKEFHNTPKTTRRNIRMRYWISAAVIIVGALICLPIYTDRSIKTEPENIESYLLSVNNRIDILINKVEMIDKVEHAILISDLRQLKRDNEEFVEESKYIDSKSGIIDIYEINREQMVILAGLEESVENNLRSDK